MCAPDPCANDLRSGIRLAFIFTAAISYPHDIRPVFEDYSLDLYCDAHRRDLCASQLAGDVRQSVRYLSRRRTLHSRNACPARLPAISLLHLPIDDWQRAAAFRVAFAGKRQFWLDARHHRRHDQRALGHYDRLDAEQTHHHGLQATSLILTIPQEPAIARIYTPQLPREGDDRRINNQMGNCVWLTA